jgi:NAD(P)-dependent dehydrogenase (short-subunit alcohol dehydrogenase family)
METEHPVALVVGGASGLGRAAACRLHDDGFVVVVADLDLDGATRLREQLGERLVARRADITDDEQVAAAAVEAASLGALRVLVCSAGLGWAERLLGDRGPHAAGSFERTIAINLTGTFAALRHAAAAMAENPPDADGGRGVCVLTSSVAAEDGQAGQVAYAASKGGVSGMVLPAARDLARHGIRVCAIAPGTFETPLLAALPERARAALSEQVPFPRRLGHPDEYASLVAEIVTNPMLNGAVLRLDGGLRMPHLGERR